MMLISTYRSIETLISETSHDSKNEQDKYRIYKSMDHMHMRTSVQSISARTGKNDAGMSVWYV
jgi:hypothetical protein